jgi:hypothetical protein
MLALNDGSAQLFSSFVEGPHAVIKSMRRLNGINDLIFMVFGFIC